MDRRLIEEELPLEAVNKASGREKSIRHGNISTMHLWWARRPLAMSRAVVLGTLLPNPPRADQQGDALKRLAYASEFKHSTNASMIGPLRDILREAYPDSPPRVLDCFAGGGAIPLEALRLRCDTTALDLNPVAFLILKGTLEFPQRFGPVPDAGKGIADDFVRWAAWVADLVRPALLPYFSTTPENVLPAAFFWCRTMPCPTPGCGVDIPLISSRWLARTGERRVWVDLLPAGPIVEITVRDKGEPAGNPDQGTVKAASATCPSCQTGIKAQDVRDHGKNVGFGARMYAVMEMRGGFKNYRSPTDADVRLATEQAGEAVAALEGVEDEDGVSRLPDEPVDSIGYINLQNLVYGYDTWRSLFSSRQLLVLDRLSQAIRQAHSAMILEGIDEDRAAALCTYLGFLVDKVADYNSTFASWAAGGEFIRSTFPRQAISMVWDFVESNPFRSDRTGIWASHTTWIELAIRHCSIAASTPATVLRGNAQRMPFEAETFDAVITDPPYYFSVMYSDLSDFFYVWLKRSIGWLYPDLFATQWTPKDEEIIQNRTNRKNERYISAEEFERRLQNALGEIARVLKSDGILTIIFAHTDVAAWEHLLSALRTAGFVVTTSWPMRSEREGRSNAVTMRAVLGSSVALVCRKQRGAGEGFYDDVVRELEERIATRLERFDGMGLLGADYFASAVGPAFEVFARYSRVVKLSGDEVDVSDLMMLARRTVAHHAMRRLLGDESIRMLDDTSLLYLTWRWAYIDTAIPADEAFKMERAFDVDLSDLLGAHALVDKSGSSFKLRGPDDRKGMKLSDDNPGVIDVLHRCCQLWDAGRRQELEAVLAETGMVNEESFWALARALAEVLPEGDRERTMLLGLTGNQEGLAHAAVTEHMKPEQPKML